MSQQNYYVEKLQLIKNLIKENKFDKALEEIVIELNMPYIPAIYETEFKNLHEVVKSNLINDSKASTTLAREEVIDMLLSDNPEQEMIALELIAEQNLRYDKVAVKQRIETWDEKDNLKKAFLFEILIEQQIDIDIKYNKDLVLNPAKTKSILDQENTQLLLKHIDSLVEKDPTISVASHGEARRYLLLTYPEVPSNPELLANSIVNIVKYMFGVEIDLSEQERVIYQTLKQ